MSRTSKNSSCGNVGYASQVSHEDPSVPKLTKISLATVMKTSQSCTTATLETVYTPQEARTVTNTIVEQYAGDVGFMYGADGRLVTICADFVEIDGQRRLSDDEWSTPFLYCSKWYLGELDGYFNERRRRDCHSPANSEPSAKRHKSEDGSVSATSLRIEEWASKLPEVSTSLDKPGGSRTGSEASFQSTKVHSAVPDGTQVAPTDFTSVVTHTNVASDFPSVTNVGSDFPPKSASPPRQPPPTELQSVGPSVSQVGAQPNSVPLSALPFFPQGGSTTSKGSTKTTPQMPSAPHAQSITNTPTIPLSPKHINPDEFSRVIAKLEKQIDAIAKQTTQHVPTQPTPDSDVWQKILEVETHAHDANNVLFERIEQLQEKCSTIQGEKSVLQKNLEQTAQKLSQAEQEIGRLQKSSTRTVGHDSVTQLVNVTKDLDARLIKTHNLVQEVSMCSDSSGKAIRITEFLSMVDKQLAQSQLDWRGTQSTMQNFQHELDSLQGTHKTVSAELSSFSSSLSIFRGELSDISERLTALKRKTDENDLQSRQETRNATAELGKRVGFLESKLSSIGEIPGTKQILDSLLPFLNPHIEDVVSRVLTPHISSGAGQASLQDKKADEILALVELKSSGIKRLEKQVFEVVTRVDKLQPLAEGALSPSSQLVQGFLNKCEAVSGLEQKCDQLSRQLSQVSATSSTTSHAAEVSTLQAELLKLQQQVLQLVDDRSQGVTTGGRLTQQESHLQLENLCGEAHAVLESKCEQLEHAIEQFGIILSEVTQGHTQVPYAQPIRGSEIQESDHCVSTTSDENEEQDDVAAMEPGLASGRGHPTGPVNMEKPVTTEVAQRDRAPCSRPGTPPLPPTFATGATSSMSGHNKSVSPSENFSNSFMHSGFGGLPQTSDQDGTHDLLAISGLPVATTPGIGFGQQGITPHPMTDANNTRRSLVGRHSVEPLDLKIFIPGKESPSGDIFRSHSWNMPKCLCDALDAVDAQMNRLKGLNGGKVKDYIRTYCDRDKKSDVPRFSGEREKFLSWCESVAKDIRDRGLSLPDSQAAYIEEVLKERLVTHNIKEVINSLPASARKNIRSLILALAPTNANTHSVGQFTNKVTNFTWAADMSYDKVRTNIENLKTWVRAANSDGGVRITQLALYERLVKVLPANFKNDLMRLEQMCHIWGHPNYMQDPNELFRWVLNVIRDQDELAVVYQVRGKDKPQETNLVSKSKEDKKPHNQKSKGEQRPKEQDNKSKNPKNVTSSASQSVNAGVAYPWSVKTAANGAERFVDENGNEVADQRVLKVAQMFNNAVWRCNCDPPNNMKLRGTDCKKCGAKQLDVARGRPQDRNNYGAGRGRGGRSAGRGGRARGRGDFSQPRNNFSHTSQQQQPPGGNFRDNHQQQNRQFSPARPRAVNTQRNPSQVNNYNTQNFGRNWNCSRCGWTNSQYNRLCMKNIYVEGVVQGICGTPRQ